MNTSYLQDVPIWLTVGPDPEHPAEELRAILVGRYSGSGWTFTIQREYSATRLGSARGSGYDKQGAALADSLTMLYRLPEIDGAAGESTVIDWAASWGVRVVTLGSALWQLDPIRSAESVEL